MFHVIAEATNGRAEHAFREKPAALNFAIESLAAFRDAANVTVMNEVGIVFSNDEIHRTFRMVRP